MRQMQLFVAVAVTLLLVSLVAIPSYSVPNQEKQDQFYVGVTYCGSSVQEAKELIDKVKNYTNLFNLLSGPLATNMEAIKEIGDYACAANLNYAIFGSTKSSNAYWINYITLEAKARWGEQFIGIYYMDEPGERMLDNIGDIQAQTTVNNVTTSIMRTTDGVIRVYLDDGVFSNFREYFPDGRITVQLHDNDEIFDQGYNSSPEERQLIDGTIIGSYKSLSALIDYYPNGTITINENIQEGTIQHRIWEFGSGNEHIPLKYDTNFYTSKNITKCSYEILSYKEILKQHPLQTVNDAAEFFVNVNKGRLEQINKEQLQEESIITFTADSALYWWDYKGGYDVILAELAWNHSVAQHIGLVRGAANLQGKNWGTILTWKYTQTPFLAEGEEMFEHMKMSYEAGAEYVLIFNYSEDPKNPNTLQEEHFLALERFWKEVVQNPKVVHGGIKAEAVLVLPKNYGWGMRIPTDTIWGLWDADKAAQGIWDQLQEKIDQHGLKLDIVFNDPDYPVEGKYEHIYYGYQRISTTVIVLAILLIIALVGWFVFFYKIRNKKHKATKIV